MKLTLIQRAAIYATVPIVIAAWVACYVLPSFGVVLIVVAVISACLQVMQAVMNGPAAKCWAEALAMCRQGRPDEALALIKRSKALRVRPELRLHAEIMAMYGLGKFLEGDVLLTRLEREPNWLRLWWLLSNDIVNARITAGRYQQALETLDRISLSSAANEQHLALIQINLAEAQYNLGDWTGALHRMEGLDEIAKGLPITRAGLMLQRAWILSHLGRGEQAWACADSIVADELPPDFRTERHFSRAAAQLTLGKRDAARQEILDGLTIAKRPSSERNGWFLLARVEFLEGRLDEAVRWCERAAEHRFKNQGGDGLLLWGDALRQLGRHDDAVAVWGLAIERDPQGESAAIAAERLAAERVSARLG